MFFFAEFVSDAMFILRYHFFLWRKQNLLELFGLNK